MTSTESDWFRDPDVLVRALQSDDGAAEGVPQIPGYEVIVELRRGSQAVVLLGRSAATGERVAIKVLQSGAWASESAKRRFDREIEIASSLSHPNIVRVLDSGLASDGHPFLIMEFVDGKPLHEYVTLPSDRKLDRRSVLRLFIAICDGVSHAHQRGIMHRDLKPSNIRVDATGRPRVLDFGLARLVDHEPMSLAATVTSQFLGTPAYAAPEQFLRKPCDIDTRADIYALGVILYQLVTGRLPYRTTDTIGGLIRSITGNEIIRPDHVLHDLSPDLNAVMLKALAGDPGERYQSVNALADDVRAVLNGTPTAARHPSRREELWRAIGRNRAVAALAAAVVVISLGFAVTTSVMALRIEQSRRSAVAAEGDALAEQRISQEVIAFLTGMIFEIHGVDDAQLEAGRMMLDRVHERMGTNPPEVPAVREELHRILGLAYMGVENFDRAIGHLHAAVADGGYKDQPLRRGHIQLLLCLALLYEGNVEEAERVIHAFLKERTAFRAAGDNQLNVNIYAAASILKVARILRREHDHLDLAEMVLREAWASSAVDADPHFVHVDIAVELAEVIAAGGGQVGEVRRILEKAITVSVQLDGPDHWRTLNAQSTLEVFVRRVP